MVIAVDEVVKGDMREGDDRGAVSGTHFVVLLPIQLDKSNHELEGNAFPVVLGCAQFYE